MNKNMKNDYSTFQINDMNEFIKEIKQETFRCYISSYKNWEDFIRVHDESRLTDKLVLFWVDHFSFVNENGSRVIHSSDYEDLLIRVYKEYCECMLNKLVDNGCFSLMWDSKKKIVYWKKNRI